MGEILLKNDILLKNERVLKDRILLELLKRMESNEILTKTHGIDKYQMEKFSKSDPAKLAEKIVYGDSLQTNYLYRNKHIC